MHKKAKNKVAVLKFTEADERLSKIRESMD